MRLAMRSRGDGPDLILLHGWGLSGEVFAPLVERLAERICCHCIDLPGHGDSPALSGLSAWTDAVADRLGRPAVWLGWSLGGLVALDAAQRYPGQVHALVLTATTPRLMQGPDWPRGLSADTVKATRAGLADDFETTVSRFLESQLRGTPAAASSIARLSADLAARPPSPAGLASGLDIIQRADLRAGLGRTKTPTCLIGGRRDRLAHPEAMRWTARTMPNAVCDIYRDAAHAPFVSEAERFADQVATFVGAYETS